MIYLTQEIASWDRFYRAHFINTLSGFKSASLIGTIDAAGQPNLAIFSNIVHLGADPALVGFVNRPLEAGGHTLTNIKETKCYTINHIHTGIMEQAHQTSAKYAQGVNEFDQVGLTADWINDFKAPFVAESKIKYGLELVQVIPIEMNGTFFVIGKIEMVLLDKELIQADGFIDLYKSGSLCSSGIDSYHSVEAGIRFGYARA
jgi:flavin reductase (DIM6/NTAB) family NADH-FMN oxidoreductase RutF